MISAYSDTEPYYPEMDSDREEDQIGCVSCGSANVIPTPGRNGWAVICGSCGETAPTAVSPNFEWRPDGKGGWTAEYVGEGAFE